MSAKHPERKADFSTTSGIPVAPVYGPPSRDPELPRPGEFPFTRGIHGEMYRGRLWTMRQYSGFGTAAETNRRFRYLLDRGQTGLSCAFDLPTQMGFDADDAMAEGEVGKVGVSIASIEDMRELLEGIPLEQVTLSMTINSTAAVLLALVVAVAEERGIDASKLGGTVQNDVLKEYIARGTYIYPPAASLRLATDIVEHCVKSMPKWNPISISGYHIREAGSTAAQEIGFTLANGVAYLTHCVKRGLDVNAVGRQVSFFFNAHNNFLEEVAKFRAARRLWAGIMKDRFGATDPRAQMLRFHAQTAGSTLTAREPENNVTRVALQAMAATLGGCQSLHTNSRDEALALPTEDSVKIALRTQQILALETGVPAVADPFGGSWFVERMTDELEKRAKEYLDRVDALGGAVAAIQAGFIQKEIERAAYDAQLAQDRKEAIVVGVNEFADEAAPSIPTLKIPPKLRERASKRLATLRRKRSGEAVKKSLGTLSDATRSEVNLVPLILAAVRARATLGEICGAMKSSFGKYVPPK
ncbi:MAG: methylmalonyl-CoA mutase [Planctomycetes bacterium]|nr:methylmalonyl-CoA mutase [Planctomycetota bacterium]